MSTYAYVGRNDGTVQPHMRLKYLKPGLCPHYPADQVGDPEFKAL